MYSITSLCKANTNSFCGQEEKNKRIGMCDSFALQFSIILAEAYNDTCRDSNAFINDIHICLIQLELFQTSCKAVNVRSLLSIFSSI